jgi:hypothetical protein
MDAKASAFAFLRAAAGAVGAGVILAHVSGFSPPPWLYLTAGALCALGWWRK